MIFSKTKVIQLIAFVLYLLYLEDIALLVQGFPA